MIKKLLFTVLLSLYILYGYSQKELSNDYKYDVSSPYKSADGYFRKYFLKGNEIMSVITDSRDSYIKKFNVDKLELISEKKYEKYFSKDVSLECVKEINDSFFLFYSIPDKHSEKLFAQEIDFIKGEFKGNAKLLITVDDNVEFNDSYLLQEEGYKRFQIFPTLDKKSCLIQYTRIPEKKNDKKSFDVIGLYSFDGNLNTILNKEITMPYTKRRIENLDFQIDKEGNFYMLNKIYHDNSNNDKKSKNDTVANSHIELFTFKPNSDKIDITKIENKDKFITSLSLFNLPNGNIMLGGYYNNGKNEYYGKNSDGIILIKMKEDRSFSSQLTYEIPLDIINEFVTEKEQRKNDRKEENGEGAKIADLKLTDLDLRKDGSILLVGEQQHQLITTTTSTSGTSIHSYFNNIIVTKINPDGTLGWMKKIPKNQRGGISRGGMSYKYFNTETDNFFVFLDNVKNINLPFNKTPALHSDNNGGYLTAVKIKDNNGEISKGSILNSLEVKDFETFQFATNRVIKTSNSSFIFEAYKKKKEDIMIKVTLK